MSDNGNGGDQAEESSDAESPGSVHLRRPDGPGDLRVVQSLCETLTAKMAVLEGQFASLSDDRESTRRLRVSLENMVTNVSTIHMDLVRTLDRLDRLVASLPKP